MDNSYDLKLNSHDYQTFTILFQDVTEESLPNICCNFEEENQCTGTKPTPCCERACTATPDGACVIRISLSLLFVLLLIITFV